MKYKNPIVIGGGIIGSSIVYHLSKLGYHIKWFEHMPFGWFSTSKAAGLIVHGMDKNKYPSVMARETITNIRTLEKQLDENIGFVKCGSLTFNDKMSNISLPTIPQFHLKHLSKHVYYNKHDGYVDPVVLAGAYKRASTNYQFINEKVEKLIIKNNEVKGVQTANEEFFGDVIDCGGSWLGELAKKIIPHKPYIPLRSHYFHVSYNGPQQIPSLMMNGLYIRHNQDNKYVLGIREKTSYHYSSPLPYTWEAEKAIKISDKEDILIENYKKIEDIFVNIDTLEINDYIAGFSNYTPDGNYIIGQVCQGLYFAGGDCGSGVSSSGGIGKMIADQSFTPIFDPLRFNHLTSLLSKTIAIRSNK